LNIVAFDCVWEYREALPPRNGLSEAIFFWRRQPRMESPESLELRALEAPGHHLASDEGTKRGGVADLTAELHGGDRSLEIFRLVQAPRLDPDRIGWTAPGEPEPAPALRVRETPEHGPTGGGQREAGLRFPRWPWGTRPDRRTGLKVFARWLMDRSSSTSPPFVSRTEYADCFRWTARCRR